MRGPEKLARSQMCLSGQMKPNEARNSKPENICDGGWNAARMFQVGRSACCVEVGPRRATLGVSRPTAACTKIPYLHLHLHSYLRVHLPLRVPCALSALALQLHQIQRHNTQVGRCWICHTRKCTLLQPRVCIWSARISSRQNNSGVAG